MKFFRFIFEDGYEIVARGFDKSELMAEEREHGKLIRKEVESDEFI